MLQFLFLPLLIGIKERLKVLFVFVLLVQDNNNNNGDSLDGTDWLEPITPTLVGRVAMATAWTARIAVQTAGSTGSKAVQIEDSKSLRLQFKGSSKPVQRQFKAFVRTFKAFVIDYPRRMTGRQWSLLFVLNQYRNDRASTLDVSSVATQNSLVGIDGGVRKCK